MDLVGENIRRIRRERGLSQKELAALSGMDRSNLSKLEAGDYTWTKENLGRLAKALKVEIAHFFAMESRVPLLGHVKAGFSPTQLLPENVTLSAIDAKLDRILKAVGLESKP